MQNKTNHTANNILYGTTKLSDYPIIFAVRQPDILRNQEAQHTQHASDFLKDRIH
jgi:hypothetical protein